MSGLTCETGLRRNIVNKEVFEREIALCRKLSRENGGKCGWGKCKDCGVVPLLHKLHEGILFEDPNEIKRAKDKIVG
jgi:hypothetical protein